MIDEGAQKDAKQTDRHEPECVSAAKRERTFWLPGNGVDQAVTDNVGKATNFPIHARIRCLYPHGIVVPRRAVIKQRLDGYETANEGSKACCNQKVGDNQDSRNATGEVPLDTAMDGDAFTHFRFRKRR